MRWGLGEDRARPAVLASARAHAGAPRPTAWTSALALLLSASRALALGGGGTGDALWRAGGTRRASGPRLRHGMVVAEARRTRNGVYLMVARARSAPRSRRDALLGLGFLAAIGILAIWLALCARVS